MGAGGALPDPAARDRGAAPARAARGVQGAAVRGPPRHLLAGDAHDLRAVLRLAGGRKAEPSAAVLDSRTRRSTPESGGRAGWDGRKRTRGSKLYLAMDTLGHLLARRVTAASEGDRATGAELALAVQDATGASVKLA